MEMKEEEEATIGPLLLTNSPHVSKEMSILLATPSSSQQAYQEDLDGELAISIHAMMGSPNPKTMRVMGQIKGA